MRPRRVERVEHYDDNVPHDTVEHDVVADQGVHHTVRREVEDTHDIEEHRGYRMFSMAAWSPAQIAAFIFGILALAIGAVALTRGGFSDFFAKTTVLGMGQTPLLGLIELTWGVLMIAAGAIPGAQRGLMSFLGAIALAGGLIVLIEPTNFNASLGTTAATGWFALVVGVLTLLITFVAPVIRTRDTVYKDHRW